LTRFHDVGLTVQDIDRSFAFYRDVVGMSWWDQDAELALDSDPEHEPHTSRTGVTSTATASAAFRELTDNPEATIRYVMMRSQDGGLILQLVEYVEGAGPVLSLGHANARSAHLSFFVDDVEIARVVATAHPAAAVRSEIVQINPNMRSFYVDDPDGVPVELLQLGDGG
jgi:catechol 2,3-dioxygenase-like lactoylglutathione lyase family enzyme